jgi:hypothetical protein
LLALAILAVLALAAVAPAGQASEGGEAQLQRAVRAAQRAAERATVRMQREVERNARREAKRKAREPIRLAHLEDANAVVKFGCTQVTIEYRGFPDVEGSPNTVTEMLNIKNFSESLPPITFPPITYTFTGSSATAVIPIVAPLGRSMMDLRSRWRTNGAKGGFDIHSPVVCGPHPAFTIEKLQAIAGSGSPLGTETVTGKVGQTVDYQMIVTNTGNTPLTFGSFSDPRCDAKTIVGGSEAPVEPMGSVTFLCAHTLTAADHEAGSYTNVATVTGTTEQGEGAPIVHESNPVVVTPIAPSQKEVEEQEAKEKEAKEKEAKEKEGKEEPKKEDPKPPPKQEVLNTPPTSSTSTSSVTGSISSTTIKSGVLGFASATIPSLHGPQGCVRGGFTVSVKSAGVSTVVFYLDGRRLKSLSAKNAHKGLLSVRIDATKLKVGAHRVLARITMKQTSSTAKAAKATRARTFVRCASAAITPHFTG